MRVIVAPDSFKGSLSARNAAEAIAAGWSQIRPDDEILLIPQADGGEGTLDAIESAVPGARRRDAGTVTGPDGRPTPGVWLQLPDGTAVVELAQCSGIHLMAGPDPLGATTRGLGEVIGAALRAGAPDLVIGLGGSASTDGGAGALDALDGLRPSGSTRLLTDVTAPLFGRTGAAAVFAPQKGATPSDVELLDRRLRDWAARFPDADPDTPGAGAAGGTAFGFLAAWDATIEPGAPAIADLTGLTEALDAADVLITGEGRFDATSLTGKVVGHALGAADAARVARVVVIAGQVALDPPAGNGAVPTSIALDRLAGTVAGALADPADWLRRAGALAAAQLDA